MLYISDVSHIPEETWNLLEQSQEQEGKPCPVLVLDCLRLLKHTSHFGVNECVTAARRFVQMGTKRTYCTGFGHEVSNEEYETIFQSLEGIGKRVDSAKLSNHERRGIELVDEGLPLWIRPAFDGLRVWISADGDVKDEGYTN